jgi:hypothetical protein
MGLEAKRAGQIIDEEAQDLLGMNSPKSGTEL